MQINTNGQRNITLDFDAPKKFKLKKDGAEIPYIRTGKNSFRLGRNIDGVLDLEEVIEQPRIVKPMQLQAQQMALVNPNDVLMINQAAQQLEVEQNILSETQKRVEQTQAYLDIQQQRVNESVLSVQGLETDNAERITATENGIFNLAGELAKAEENSADADNYIISELDEHKKAENPHGITKETIGLNKVDNTSDLDKPISKAVQSALDEKADKDEIQAIRDELGEYQEKNDRFTNALSYYTGGLAGNQLPDGGLTGQILAKRSDMSGDAEWIDNSASIDVDDALSLTSENPVQNKVITLAVNNISDEITAIESKIPAQASSSNQLADKDFVNSSIATNTATFRGTFNSVAELEAYSGEKDNNDYAFVTGVDSLGNTYYDRYKYNGVSWVYEYRLNNSSFTSAQWASINSGATTQSINQISTNTTNISSLQTSKQDVISDLATIRSGAALGATAVQPSDLATKQDVLTSENEGNCINIAMGGSSGLPSEYQEVEYLQSSGTQYIDTGVPLDDTMTIRVKYDFIRAGFVFGSRSSSSSRYSGITNETGGAYNIRYGNTVIYNQNTTPSGTVDVVISPNGVVLNGETVSTTAYGDSFYAGNCYLFTSNNNGSPFTGDYAINRIRRFTIDNVIDLVPCKRKSDNVLGMYDLVNDEFLPNAGTGTFIAGGNVEEITKISFVNDAGYITSADLPTVNNPTITFTQGGTTKGTITLNQSSNQTIAFDAGGSDVEAFTAAEVQAIWEAN